MRDRYERKHRRTARHPESVAFMESADMDNTMSLAAAMGQLRCIHAGRFPCPQCTANRRWNAAAGFPITDAEFERRYAHQPGDPPQTEFAT